MRQHVPPKRRCQNPSNYHLINNRRERLKTYAELYIFHKPVTAFTFTHVHYSYTCLLEYNILQLRKRKYIQPINLQRNDKIVIV